MELLKGLSALQLHQSENEGEYEYRHFIEKAVLEEENCTFGV
jgi:hypothetical protein